MGGFCDDLIFACGTSQTVRPVHLQIEEFEGASGQQVNRRKIAILPTRSLDQSEALDVKYRWKPAVVDELLSVVLWCPMLFTDIRAEMQTTAYITDASLTMAGCCSRSLPADAAAAAAAAAGIWAFLRPARVFDLAGPFCI